MPVLRSGKEVSIIEMCHNPSLTLRRKKSCGTWDSKDLTVQFKLFSSGAVCM